MIAAILASPETHVGKVYELTGPRSQDLHGLAAEYAEALGRPVTYVDVPFDEWRDYDLRPRGGLPDHVYEHFLTMAKLHAEGRYDRLTHDVEAVLGRPATSVPDFGRVTPHPSLRSRSANCGLPARPVIADRNPSSRPFARSMS